MSYQTGVKLADGIIADLEVVTGKSYIHKIKIAGKKYKAVDPYFNPVILTDGKYFYEFNEETLQVFTKIEILPDGSLFSKEVKPLGSTRTQIATYLLSLPPQKRLSFSSGAEKFLLDSEEGLKTPLLSAGYRAGASVKAEGKTYRYLGNKRYPTLFQKDREIYVHFEGSLPFQPLFLKKDGTLYTQEGVKKTPKQLSVEGVTRWGYFNFAADRLKDFSKEVQGKLSNFFEQYIKSLPLGVEVELNKTVFPEGLLEKKLVDEKKNPLSEGEMKKRAVNFVMHMISKASEAKTFLVTRKEGRNTLDILGALSPSLAARLLSLNPYRCSPEEGEKVRYDWLISVVLNDSFYREVHQIGETISELEEKLGVNTGFRSLAKDNINVATRFSGVAHVGRVANYQLQKKNKNQPFFGTYDFAVDAQEKVKQKEGDFRKFPSTFVHGGGEFIWYNENASLVFALYKKDGGKLAAAPDSLVNDRETQFGPFIRNPVSCLVCHPSGARSPFEGSFENLEAWVLKREEFDQDAALKKKFGSYEKYLIEIKKYYQDAEAFVEKAETASRNFVKSLHTAKAFVGEPESDQPFAFIPEIYQHYQSNLSFREAAKELGCTYEEFKRLIPPSGYIPLWSNLGLEVVDYGRESMRREQFEKVYCELKKKFEEYKREPAPDPKKEDHL